MSMGGRESKLNMDVIKGIADEVADGLPIMYACDLYEVHNMSYLNWLKQGASDYDSEIDSLYRAFFVAIKKAYAKFVRESKKIIRAGANGWQGTAWWLERTNKEFQMNNENGTLTENISVNTKMKPRKETKNDA